MILKNTFDNLTKEQISTLNQYFDGYDYELSSCTYISNYIWRNTHKMTWEIIGEYLFISRLDTVDIKSDNSFILFPLTKTGIYDEKKLKESFLQIENIFRTEGKSFQIGLIPKELVHYIKDIYGDRASIYHDRDYDDYIYLKEDLISLSGRKLHQKKNHLNYFMRENDYIYEEVSVDMRAEILDYIESKNKFKLDETPDEWKDALKSESIAIEELLDFVGKGVIGGIIRIDGRIVAVTLGEYANTNDRKTAIVHIEKADDRIRGLYQAINNEFCKRLPDQTIYVNREEDMGLSNLRQTKLSYNPVKLSEKYFVTIR